MFWNPWSGVTGTVRCADSSRRRRLREPRGLRVPGGRRLQVCDPIAYQQRAAGQHRLPAQAPSRSPSHRGPAVLCQLQLSGAKLEETAPRRGEGRMASGRTLSARRLYRDQPIAPGRARRCLLQRSWHGGAVDQGRKECVEVDAAVMLLVRRQRCASATPRARLQPCELPAHAGLAGPNKEVVTDKPAGKARQDRREACRPRALYDLPDGRGRSAARFVPAHSANDRRASTRANGAMLSHAAPPHAPSHGRTTSANSLNGPKCQLPAVQSRIGAVEGRNDSRAFPICRGRGYTSLPGGWSDRPSGKCRFNCSFG